MATTTKSKVQRKEPKVREAPIPQPENRSVFENKPTEEQIRQKAEEIYNERLVRGEYGTALDDWQKAEQLLSENE